MCGSSRWSVGLLVGGLVALLAGCPEREISALPGIPARVERKEIPRFPELDLLFVIDSSPSMAKEQGLLADNFNRFIDVLVQQFPGGLPSLHLGVITPDLGTQGGMKISSCTAAGDGGVMRGPAQQPFLRDVFHADPAERSKNYSGTLHEAFRSMASVGIAGCGFEAHLGALDQALRLPVNAGFLRPSAYLAVVVIADEDDCSVRPDRARAFFGQADLEAKQSFACFRSSTECEGPVSEAVGPRQGCHSNERSLYHWAVGDLVRSLKELKEEQETIVAGIIGPPAPVSVEHVGESQRPDVKGCTYQIGADLQAAAPGVRLAEFVTSFRNHALTTICAGDLTSPIERIASLISETARDAPCLRSVPAVPHECTVADVIDPRGPGRQEFPIPPCGSTPAAPCWHIVTDADRCPRAPSKEKLEVVRGSTSAPVGSRVIAECVAQ